MIKTRFAPSPTGELHIGAARTALFAYLFAKSQGGEFLLRIEDTDRERFVEGSIERIIESLKWLNVVADNIDSPMIQSDRKEVYKKHAIDLVNTNKAYICTCSKEKLAKDRERQEKSKLPPRYEGDCREKIQDTPLRQGFEGQARSKIQISDKLPEGAVIRMKMPKNEKIVVDDLVRGKVEFDSALIDDQIILKSDGFPTYHLAAVVDDHEMQISHIIRAEEWLSSTPKHITLFNMFGWEVPEYAHLPMILGSDKKKLSKRHGATSVKEYKDRGYLPEAIVNFMAFLGWNPKDDSQHHFTLEKLISIFDINNVNKSAAVFDLNKLTDYNEYYLKNLSEGKITKLLIGFNLVDVSASEIDIIKRGGYKTLKEVADYILKLRKTPKYDSKILIFKKSDKEKTKKGIQYTANSIQGVKDWSADNLQIVLQKVVEDTGLSNGDVFWPVRVALSGEERSPSPVELMVALGKEESLKRIEKATEELMNPRTYERMN